MNEYGFPFIPRTLVRKWVLKVVGTKPTVAFPGRMLIRLWIPRIGIPWISIHFLDARWPGRSSLIGFIPEGKGKRSIDATTERKRDRMASYMDVTNAKYSIVPRSFYYSIMETLPVQCKFVKNNQLSRSSRRVNVFFLNVTNVRIRSELWRRFVQMFRAYKKIMWKEKVLSVAVAFCEFNNFW